jgi:hypothetical protein
MILIALSLNNSFFSLNGSLILFQKSTKVSSILFSYLFNKYNEGIYQYLEPLSFFDNNLFAYFAPLYKNKEIIVSY